MKTFSSIKEFIDYIPNCILCKKEMQIAIHAIRKSEKNWNYDNIHIKTSVIDNMIISKNKDYKLEINMYDNTIVSGSEFISSIENNTIDVNKSCKTCNFKIKAIHNSKYTSRTKTNKIENFPSLVLAKEELYYTRNGGKNVVIVKYHPPSYDASANMWITINNKKIQSFNLDLSKLKDLDHLNSKLSTLITFQ